MILTITANPAIDKVYFVDDFVMGEVRRPNGVTASAGGKGLNVARVASILGEDVTASGFLGGLNGQYIKNELAKTKIKDEFIEIEGETRICINISDKNGISGEILEKGPKLSENDEKKFVEYFEKNIEKFDIVSISGSLPQGISKEFYSKLIRICKNKNKRVFVDTSGEMLKNAICEKPFMVKPNKDELFALYQDISTVKEGLERLKNEGVEIPFCTLGKDGSAAIINGEYKEFKTVEVKTKNCVGSGDSTVAGILTGLSRKMKIEDAIMLGMACGIANTQFEQTGMVTEELVEEYFNILKKL